MNNPIKSDAPTKRQRVLLFYRIHTMGLAATFFYMWLFEGVYPGAILTLPFPLFALGTFVVLGFGFYHLSDSSNLVKGLAALGDERNKYIIFRGCQHYFAACFFWIFVIQYFF